MNNREQTGAGTPAPGAPEASEAPDQDGWAWRLAGPAAGAGVLAAHLGSLSMSEGSATAAVLVVLAGVISAGAAWFSLRRFAADCEARGSENATVRGAGGIRAAGRASAAGVPLLAVFLGYAAWAAVTHERVAGDAVSRQVTAAGTPVVLEGTLVGAVTIRPADRGAFAAFNYRRSRTLGRLEVERQLDASGVWAPVSGRVFFKVNEPAAFLAEGQRVRVAGTLQAFTPPENPGSFDFAAAMERAGVAGRLTANRSTSVQLLPGPGGLAGDAAALRVALRDQAWEGLSAGFADGSPAASLLGSLLLGRNDPELQPLREDFRRLGLAHLLSISGAHLGILVLLMIGVARTLPVHPRTATLLVLATVGFYLLLVPVRVPVLRAALMALAFLGPSVIGRGMPPGRSLSLAALLVLAWRPGELFMPGFQLSFLAVWAIVAFAKPISERLHPPPLRTDTGHSPALSQTLLRQGVDVLAVSLAAAAVTAPVVLFHFGLFSPLAVLGSVVSWVPFGLVLGLGHLKLALGLLHPGLGAWLAAPLGGLLDASAWAVAATAALPGTAWAPPRPVPLAWGLAALLAVIVGLRATRARGWPGRLRPGPTLAATLVLGAWLALSQGALDRFAEPPLLRTTMIAVGDGSAWLVESGGETMMFDCGSSSIAQVGEREVVPALRSMGVGRIDTLVISHADLDHFSGVLELCDALPVGRVVCSPEVTTEALDVPGGAAAVLLHGLGLRGVLVEIITAGARWPLGRFGADCHVLWPPPGLTLADARNSNDHSVVLRTRLPAASATSHAPARPERSVLLSGDVQQHAITALLAGPHPLRSTLADIPHHGSVVRASPAWLAASDPALLLQSTGRRRLKLDKWAALLVSQPRPRLASARTGMVRVAVEADGSLAFSTHRGGGGRIFPAPERPREALALPLP